MTTLTRSPAASTGTPRNPLTITFSGSDAGSGIARSEYQVNGAQWIAADGPVLFDAVGTHLISYRSIDRAGNAEPARSIALTVTPDPATALKVSARKVSAGGFVTLLLTGFQRHDSITIELGGSELGRSGPTSTDLPAARSGSPAPPPPATTGSPPPGAAGGCVPQPT